MNEIAKAADISEERVRYIFYEVLSMIEICASWVPNTLNADQKQSRKRIFSNVLIVLKEISTDFMRRFVFVWKAKLVVSVYIRNVKQ